MREIILSFKMENVVDLKGLLMVVVVTISISKSEFGFSINSLANSDNKFFKVTNFLFFCRSGNSSNTS